MYKLTKMYLMYLRLFISTDLPNKISLPNRIFLRF